MRLCPARPLSPADVFVFDQRGLDAVLALGLFELQSGLQYKDKVLPYLIDVLKGIPSARWLNSRGLAQTPKTPMPGDFVFCFVTLMSSLADKDNSIHGDVMNVNIAVFKALVDQCHISKDVKDLRKGTLLWYIIPPSPPPPLPPREIVYTSLWFLYYSNLVPSNCPPLVGCGPGPWFVQHL